MDLSVIFTPQVNAAIRVFAILFSAGHIIVSLVLFNFIRSVSRQVHTPHEGIFKALAVVHMMLLTVILLAIIFLF